MSSVVAPYRSDVAIGKIVMGGKEISVYGSEFFIRYLNQQLLDRLGGTDQSTIADLVAEINEINDAGLSASPDGRSNEVAASIDELRGELAGLRNDCDALRSAIFDRDAEIAALRNLLDLRNRVEQLEGMFP